MLFILDVYYYTNCIQDSLCTIVLRDVICKYQYQQICYEISIMTI